MTLLRTLIFVALLAWPAFAGVGAWTGTGPPGGPIRSILVVDPLTIYVGTLGSGLWKSGDGGGTWAQAASAGNALATRTVRALVRDPASGEIYAGVEDPVDAPSGGVFVLTSGGTTWTVMDTGLSNKKVMALAFDGSFLYAGTKEEDVGNTTVIGGVFKWNGSTWTRMNTGLDSDPGQCVACARQVQALAVDTRPTPPTPPVLYAGTNGVGVYKSFDRGVTWIRPSFVVNPLGPPSPLDGISNQGFRSSCLGTSNLDQIEILALVVDTTTCSASSPCSTCDALSCSPLPDGSVRPETLYAGATGAIGNTGCGPTPVLGGHKGIGEGFFRFAPESPAPGWNRRMGGEFESPELPTYTTLSTNVWSIVMDGSTIYLGTDLGVFRSTSGTGSWNRMPFLDEPPGLISLPVRALGLDSTGNVTLYAGMSGRGVFKRPPPNNGSSVGPQPWTEANGGLTALRSQAVGVGRRGGSKAVFGGLSSGGIITSIDDGATWQNTPETSRTVRGFSVDPTNPSTVYAATARGVLKTVNGGDTWAVSSTGLPTTTSQDPNDPTPPRTVRSIIVDPADPNTLYAAVRGIYRSVNGGANWTSVNGNLPAAVTIGTGTVVDGTVSAFVIDQVSQGVNTIWGNLYAATDGSGVYRSSDGGVTWALVAGLSGADLSVVALAFDPLGQGGPTLFAGTSTGKVFRSVAGGSWAAFGTGLPGHAVSGLVVRLGLPSKVYAGLNGGGVYSIAANSQLSTAWTSMNAGLLSLNVAGLALDPEFPGRLHAATLGRGIFDFEISNTSTPFVNFTSPLPPGPFVTATSAFPISGTAGVSTVFWSTNRGHAGFVTPGWSASVPLEPGPNVITVTAVDGSFNQGSVAITVTLTSNETPSDFNGDGKADVLLRNSSGLIYMWLMNGTSIGSAGSPGTVDAAWTVQGTGDFDGDGKTDVLWRHSAGLIYIWFMNGTTINSSSSPGSVDAGWTIEGIGDFNGDGKADILWRHSSGLVYIWLMNGSNIIGTASPGSVGTDWTIEGVADFDGNGKADILWRHVGGLLSIWLMNATTISSTGSPGSVDAAWTVHGIGDFDGNGKADILWRHSGGLLSIWLMNATTISSAGSPGSVGLDWTIQDAVDFNGNGKADILWRHSGGLLSIWLMNGTAIGNSGSPGTLGPEWVIQ